MKTIDINRFDKFKGDDMYELEIEAQEVRYEIKLADQKMATLSDFEKAKSHPVMLNPPQFFSVFDIMRNEELVAGGCQCCFDFQEPYDMVGELKFDSDVVVSLSYRDKFYVVSVPHAFDASRDLQIKHLGLRINGRFIPGYDFSLASCDFITKIEPEEWKSAGRCIVKPDGETLQVAETGI